MKKVVKMEFNRGKKIELKSGFSMYKKSKNNQYSRALFYLCNSGHPSTSDGSDEKVISSGQFECA